MAKVFEFARPVPGKVLPAGPQWIHEIKFDGFRMRAREGDRVRLFTTNGADWTDRYPGSSRPRAA
ncbi:hypothetical protein HU675_0035480 [Bradyrhizobium septentrionale]|uniref:hypothetical protein n=1 Tax=Bradyrhizobium septentrionale TaxID=1404411 RepID=UPI0015968185|nr:hypothetical protein [Bradyrhizobium septentrionale]UGY23221.1 hypothetical protein HU675_0035480 [Bradyrhizobium septentrionale]